MPRPSLKDQRSGEILDAYLTCVARYGLEGATQERIAAIAGVKRPLLRHYLGNRDEMIRALTAHVVDGFARSTGQMRDILGETGTPDDLIGVLFADAGNYDARLMLAYQALVTSIADYPDMRAPLLDSLVRYLEVIQDVLRRAAPDAQPARIGAVAQGVSALAVHAEALSPLEPPPDWRDEQKDAALLLISTLETTS